MKFGFSKNNKYSKRHGKCRFRQHDFELDIRKRNAQALKFFCDNAGEKARCAGLSDDNLALLLMPELK